MAIRRVYSGAAGANDGTSWTDAYVDIQSAWAAWASGDVIYIASDHSQTQASNEDFAANAGSTTNPTVMYSVDRSNDAYLPATAAQIAVTGTNIGIIFTDSIHAYGIFFQVENGAFTGSNVGQTFEDCNFKHTGTTATRAFTVGHGSTFSNCTFDNTSGAGAYSLTLATSSGIIFRGCVIKGRGASNFISHSDVNGNYEEGCLFIGCDFSALTTSTSLTASGGAIRFVDCRFVSGILPNAAGGVHCVVKNYASAIDGSTTAKNYIAEHLFYMGAVTQDTAIYRDAGWQDEDGATRLSHKMTPGSVLRGSHTPIFGPDLRAYVATTGSKTFTVYGVEDFTAALTLDQAWIEVCYLGTADSVIYACGHTRTALSATGLTSDSVAWTGASGKTKVKFAKTVTINKVGTYIVRVYLGKYEASKALWYCPLVEVT